MWEFACISDIPGILCLTYNRNILEDSQTIESLGFTDGTVLRMHVLMEAKPGLGDNRGFNNPGQPFINSGAPTAGSSPGTMFPPANHRAGFEMMSSAEPPGISPLPMATQMQMAPPPQPQLIPPSSGQQPLMRPDGPVMRSAAARTVRDTSNNMTPQVLSSSHGNHNQVAQSPELIWPDHAFKDDDLSYRDNIRIYQCYPWLRWLSVIFVGSHNHRVWFVKDIAGILAAAFTWLLVIVGEIALVYSVLLNFHDATHAWVHGIFSITMAFLGIVAHSRCMFSNPGAIPRGNATRENIQKLGKYFLYS